MHVSLLEELGLTFGEARTYAALLSIGQSSTGPIVKKSGVSTSKTYKILQRLETKGLVSHVKKEGVLHWSACAPNRILELLEQEEKNLQNRKEKLENILPELTKKFTALQKQPQAEVYMGMKGMQSVFADETQYFREHADEVNIVIGISSLYEKRYADFFRRLETRRDMFGMKRKLLVGESLRGEKPWIENSAYCTVRYLPFPDSPVSINVYGETSFISLLAAEPMFFVVHSKEVAKSFTDYFWILWKLAL